jgi:chloramphenicol-sensitive protein RarD
LSLKVLLTSASDQQRGTVLGVIAYLIWGFAALYWVETKPVDARDILAHRALWSLPVIVMILIVTRRLRASVALLRQPRALMLMACSAFCSATNWGIFLWAVTNGQATQASMGYFLLPLINVAIGLTLFHERIDKIQAFGVFCAGAAMLLQIIYQGGLPLVALGVALSFALYGAIRKGVTLGSLEGLFIETLFMAPFAVYWLVTRDFGGLGQHGLKVDLFLLGSGVMTTVPLLAYVAASRLMPLTALGLVFYIGPTAQLVVAVAILGEAFDRVQMLAFGLVWLGLLAVTADSVRRLPAFNRAVNKK